MGGSKEPKVEETKKNGYSISKYFRINFHMILILASLSILTTTIVSRQPSRQYVTNQLRTRNSIPTVTTKYSSWPSKLYCPTSCRCIPKWAKCRGLGYGNKSFPIDRIPLLGMPQQYTTLWLENFSFPLLTDQNLGKYRSLKTLRVRSSNITRLSVVIMLPLRSLKTLDLSYNNLTEVPAINRLSELSSIDLSHNHLFGDATTRYPYETHVNISTQNDSTLLRLVNLKKKFGAKSKFALPKLVQISLAHNQLTRISDSTFHNCTKLKELYLDHNRIRCIDSLAFETNHNLVRLTLKNNELKDVSAENLEHSPNLNCAIAGLIGGVLNPLLKTLDLSNNLLTHIPDNLPAGLSELRLTGNHIEKIDEYDVVSHEFHLENLYLNYNNITYIQDNIFASFHRLTNLWLNDNSLTKVPAQFPPTLMFLYLQNNKIGPTLISNEFYGLNKLLKLYLQNNRLEHIPAQTFDPPINLGNCCLTLDSLFLQQNQLALLYKRQFAGLSALTMLNLARNPLQVTESSCFAGLNRLRTLRLTQVGAESWIQPDDIHSFLTTVTAQHIQMDSEGQDGENKEQAFDTLRSTGLFNKDRYFLDLNLFHDIAKTLEVLTINGSPKLASYLLFHVNLHVNNPTSISTLDLLNSTLSITRNDLIFDSLIELDLDNNNLTTLPAQFSTMFPSIIALRVATKNTWHCDFKIQSLIKVLQNESIKIPAREKVVCATPKALAGALIYNLSLNDIRESLLGTTFESGINWETTTRFGSFESRNNFFNANSTGSILMEPISSSFATSSPSFINLELSDLFDLSSTDDYQNFTNLSDSTPTKSLRLGTSFGLKVTLASSPKSVKTHYKGTVRLAKKPPETWLAISGTLTIVFIGLALLALCLKYEPWKLLRSLLCTLSSQSGTGKAGRSRHHRDNFLLSYSPTSSFSFNSGTSFAYGYTNLPDIHFGGPGLNHAATTNKEQESHETNLAAKTTAHNECTAPNKLPFKTNESTSIRSFIKTSAKLLPKVLTSRTLKIAQKRNLLVEVPNQTTYYFKRGSTNFPILKTPYYSKYLPRKTLTVQNSENNEEEMDDLTSNPSLSHNNGKCGRRAEKVESYANPSFEDVFNDEKY